MKAFVDNKGAPLESDAESRMSEAELHSTATRLGAIIEFLPDATFVIDTEHRVIAWNRALEEMTGVSKQEMLGRSDYEYSRAFYGERRPILIDLIDKDDPAIESTYDHVERINYMLFAEVFIPGLNRGKGAHLWIKASPLHDSEGRRLGAIESVRDITAKKQAESVLREREEQFRSAFDNAPLGMALRSRDNSYLRVNDALSRMLGYTKEEICQSRVVHMTHPEDRDLITNCIARMIEEGRQSATVEKRYITKSGVTILAMVTLSTVMDPDGELDHVILQIQDITEQREAHQRLVEMQERLRDLAWHLQVSREDERRVIAREIHDELGQTLTLMSMDLKWISSRLPKEPSGQLMDRIHSTQKVLQTALQSIHTLSVFLRPRILDDFGVVAAVEWQAQEFERHTNIKVQLELEPSSRQIDKERSITIYRLIQEALTNVARHAKATRVTVYMRLDPKEIVMRICDNGRGIDDDALNRRNSFGLLGMRERVHHLGGELHITGKKDKGTSIFINIPMVEEAIDAKAQDTDR